MTELQMWIFIYLWMGNALSGGSARGMCEKFLVMVLWPLAVVFDLVVAK